MAPSGSLPAAAVSAPLSLLLPLLLLSACLAGSASGVVHKVGDAAGWTTINAPNYTAWALSKTFHVGDTLLFEYNKQYHNVEQVNKADYRACDGGNPLAMYATGSDSVPLNATGRYYFICGFPGHCLAGQRFDILVQKPSSAAAAGVAPAAAPGPASGGGGGAAAGGAGAGSPASPAGATSGPAKNAAAAAGRAAGLAAAVTALAAALL